MRSVAMRTIGLVMCIAAMGGCSGGQVASEDEDALGDATDAVEATRANDDGGPPGRPDGMRGPAPLPAVMIRTALETNLQLTSKQKAAIEAARDTLRPPPPTADRQARRAALAAAIRAGSIDVKALQAGDDPKAAREAHRAKMAAALNALHEALTAAQRTALVGAVKARLDAQQPPPPPPEPPPQDGGHAGPPGPLGFLMHDIALSPAQRDQIEAALSAKGLEPPPPTASEMAARHEARVKADKALLDAFVEASFDAAEHGPRDVPHVEPPPFLEVLAVIVPILNASQRETLASNVESGPPEHAPPPPDP